LEPGPNRLLEKLLLSCISWASVFFQEVKNLKMGPNLIKKGRRRREIIAVVRCVLANIEEPTSKKKEGILFPSAIASGFFG